ncbi:MAG: shikimate dehydrogenase [Candidatus Omnitrophota bacterium]
MTSPRIYGLIGYPVQHSLSPLMHNAAFSYFKINAEYKLFSLKEQEIEVFLRNLNKNNVSGLNVTVPYKEKVIPFIETISEEAGLIGAVNTIKVINNKLEGSNTDGEGFLKHLTIDLKFSPAEKKIALIGAGGAARAITVYLCKSKPKSITIFDVDKKKLSALISHLKANFPQINLKPADSIERLQIEESDLLINAAPIGMKDTDPCLLDEKFIHKDLFVYDLIYNPQETKLLKLARQKDAKVSNGLGMLLYQGMLAFEIWTGQKAPKEIMQKALLGGLRNA